MFLMVLEASMKGKPMKTKTKTKQSSFEKGFDCGIHTAIRHITDIMATYWKGEKNEKPLALTRMLSGYLSKDDIHRIMAIENGKKGK